MAHPRRRDRRLRMQEWKLNRFRGASVKSGTKVTHKDAIPLEPAIVKRRSASPRLNSSSLSA